MLTRLKIFNFKNLVNVSVRFGPFTCIAGANGVGKSNLLDAISFLNLLAEKPIKEAALAVRGGETARAAIWNLFHRRVGASTFEQMSFEVEMIIPRTGKDSLGRELTANATVASYELVLEYFNGRDLDIVLECLLSPHQMEFPRFPKFDGWENIVVLNHDPKSVDIYVTSNKESGRGYRNVTFLGFGPTMQVKSELPRTVLSLFTNNFALEMNPVITLSGVEMRDWRVLQIEPSSMRRPDNDNYNAPEVLGSDGAHLATTLFRIAREYRDEEGNPDPEYIYQKATNRLAELIGDVQSLRVEDDEKRELYTLYLTDRSGTEHPARSLSDGTLRFLALIVLWLDPKASGVFCIEEPENGIHPAKLPALVRLLQDIAVDPNRPVGPDNPLRQVIIVTHSPEIVKLVPDDSLLAARLRGAIDENGVRYSRAEFAPLPGTWRVTDETPATATVSRNELLAYLNPTALASYSADELSENGDTPHRVMDREDLQPLLKAK